MESINEIRKAFIQMVTLSLTPRQVEHIGQEVDGGFNIYRETGFKEGLPIPRQSAAEALVPTPCNSSNKELIQKIIKLLLGAQNLKHQANDIFFCIRELATNASKANYKIIFKDFIAPESGINPEKIYICI